MSEERKGVVPDYWVMCRKGGEEYACNPCAVLSEWPGRATPFISNKVLGPWGAECVYCGTLAG